MEAEKTAPATCWLVVSIGVACLALGVHASAAPVPYTPSASTQLLYHLNETSGTTAADASGHGRDATYGANVILGQPAQPGFGYAISSQTGLAGRTYYTDTGTGVDSFLYASGAVDFSVDTWVKLDNLDFTSRPVIFSVQPNGSTEVDYNLALLPSTNSFHPRALTFSDNGDANKVFVNGGLTWDTDTWYHIAVEVHQDTETPENSYIRIYRNAAGDTPTVVAERNGADALITSSSLEADRNFEIANQYGNSGKDFFPGEVDEVRFSRIVPEPGTVAMTFLLGLGLAIPRRR